MDPRAARVPAQNAADEQAKSARERRRHLPVVPMLSTRHLFSSEGKDYSRFALSPMTSHAFTRLQPGDWTPVTAIHLNDQLTPAIASPTGGPGMSLLDRYLSENQTPSSAVSLKSPMTMQKANISDTLPTPCLWTSWGAVMGSPPESTIECFSPVLGEGPAEQEHAFEDRTYEPPTDNESEADTENTFIEEDYGSNRASRVFDAPPRPKIFPRRNSFPRYENKHKTKTTILVTLPNGLTAAPKSAPLDPKGALTQPPTPAFPRDDFPKEDVMGIMAPPPAPTIGTFADKLPQVKLTLAGSPFDPPPAPTTGSFSEALPTPIATIERSVFDPPPAPTISQFPEEFPASPVTAGPAPIDTSKPFGQWRRTDGPHTAMDFPVIPEERFQSIVGAINPTSPPPAPTQMSFGLAFPASPVHSKPSPIDTTRSPDDDQGKGKALGEAETPGPGATPPAPTQERFVFKTAKMVRFAVSPLSSAHFKIPISPASPSPRFQSFPRHVRTSSADKARGRRDTGIVGSASRDESPMTDREHSVPSTPSSFRSRGRSPYRTGSKCREPPRPWRPARSQSPKCSAKMVEEEEEETIPILPNTVYDPSSNKVYTTKGQVNSDKYIILQTYFKRKPAAPGEPSNPNEGIGGIRMTTVNKATLDKLPGNASSQPPAQTQHQPDQQAQASKPQATSNLQQSASTIVPPAPKPSQTKPVSSPPATPISPRSPRSPTQIVTQLPPAPALYSAQPVTAIKNPFTAIQIKPIPPPPPAPPVHQPLPQVAAASGQPKSVPPPKPAGYTARPQVNGLLAKANVHPLFSNPPSS